MDPMSLAHQTTTDYNLLVPLLALLEERHVTRAAERCGMSQPAMSRALERARIVFSDELLERRGHVYERTPRGERLFVELQDILPRLSAAVSGAPFEPTTSRDRFRVIATDYAATIVLPFVAAEVATRAPEACVELTAWDGGAFDAMREGRYDLAIAGLDGAWGLEREPLFVDDFVCLLATNHPIGDTPLTLERYVAYPHVSIDIGDGLQMWIERPLHARGYARRIAFSTPSLFAAALAIVGTDMICTLSRRWCERFAGLADVRMVAAPPGFESFRYGMGWHARATSDAALWFRDVVRNSIAARFERPRDV